MNITLTRFAYLSSCTLGELVAGPLTLATLERPWRENPEGPGGIPKESCVPDGQYLIKPWNSERFPDTYILLNNVLGVYEQPALIPQRQKFGRSAILIHAGNTVQDVIGCIAVGTEHGGGNTVINSRIAMDRLRAVLGIDTFHTLTIRPTSGTSEIA